MRSGFTTGTCAAAAAKGAAILLSTGETAPDVEIGLPDGGRVRLPLEYVRMNGFGAEAAVVKDAGDDPDITNGATIIASVSWFEDRQIVITGGEGVGVVTKPGLSVMPGEAAINPVPRRMIEASLREVTDKGVAVTISIPGGRELAFRTFNPRLGIVDGLSILGTSGRVRPFSCPALRTSLKCVLDVAAAEGIKAPVFVPGHIGARAAKRHFRVSEGQVMEVSNEWGFMVDEAAKQKPDGLLIVGHPGKLAKLAMGAWQTHSSRSPGAVPFVASLVGESRGRAFDEMPTVEGIFAALNVKEREVLGRDVAARIGVAVRDRLGGGVPVAVVLVNMRGDIIGRHGDMSSWL